MRAGGKFRSAIFSSTNRQNGFGGSCCLEGQYSATERILLEGGVQGKSYGVEQPFWKLELLGSSESP